MKRKQLNTLEAGDFDNVQHPLETNYTINLPEGFKQVYGEDIDDNLKAKACHYGFHPVDDDGILTGTFKEGALAYQGRKKSRCIVHRRLRGI